MGELVCREIGADHATMAGDGDHLGRNRFVLILGEVPGKVGRANRDGVRHVGLHLFL